MNRALNCTAAALACLGLGFCLAGSALAQNLAPVPVPPRLDSLPKSPAPAAAAAPAANAVSADSRADPRADPRADSRAGAEQAGSQRKVIEDDNVRVEETRVRGQLQRITVHNKAGGKDYEILVGPGGRDPSQKRDAAGQRAWSLFSF